MCREEVLYLRLRQQLVVRVKELDICADLSVRCEIQAELEQLKDRLARI